LTPQSQKEIERKEEGERLETYTVTHSDRRCQLRKDKVQNIVRLDEGEEEVVAVSQKWLSLQHSERGEYFHVNPPARVGDFIFNTNPQ